MALSFDEFLEEMCKKKIAFIGTGISNLNILNTLIKQLNYKFNLTVLDHVCEEKLNLQILNLKKYGVVFKCGPNYLDNLNEFDVLIRCPGVYFNEDHLQKAISDGIILTSEMEIFFDICPCKIIGITGSDGKTTTTTLIAKMLQHEGFNVHMGGNIGIPLFNKLPEIKPNDIVVVELSSFQLISMCKSPDVAIITNVSPNHLDIHKTMEEYLNAKLNIAIHQSSLNRIILNFDCEYSKIFKNKTRSQILEFSLNQKLKNGVFFENSTGNIYYSNKYKNELILNSNEIKLLGEHNIQNYLTAIATVFDLVSIKTIKYIAKSFNGVSHRLELIKKYNEISWFNDSIATTPTRTIAALKCFNENIILIAGGYDKNISFDKLALQIIKKVKILILTGATANKIEFSVRNCEDIAKNNLIIEHAINLDHAVKIADSLAKSGDVVLFSPASASFDSYKNFEERGQHFKSLVLKDSF